MPDYHLVKIWCAPVECQKKISNKRKTCKNGKRDFGLGDALAVFTKVDEL